jgi:hypothetical protein
LNNNPQTLGGTVKAQYSASTEEGLDAAYLACKEEQEAICGYALVPTYRRQTHYVIGDGASAQDVYEVFVTFAPAPVDGADGAST